MGYAKRKAQSSSKEAVSLRRRRGFPALGQGQMLTGHANEFGDIVAVVDIGNVEIVLRAFVGRSQFHTPKHCPPGIGGLQVEAVVADESEDDTIAIDAKVAKHLLHGNLTGTTTLVGNIFYEIRMTRHEL